MYEVIVRTYCLGRGYETYNEINVPFDCCYEDKKYAVKAYDEQIKAYYRESEGDLYREENGSFKIEKKRNGYSIIIRGELLSRRARNR